MNEQLQEKLVEILNGIQEAARATGDFAMEQLPDIAAQYVLYGRISSTTGVLIALIGFCASLFVALRFGFFSKKAYEGGDWTDEGFFSAVIGGSLAMGFFVLFVCAAQSALLVWLAPKVWLLKEIAGLLK